MNSTNRREFLKAGGAALGLMTISGLAVGALACSEKTAAGPKTALPSASPTAPVFPWPYQKLEAVAAAEGAYTAYYNGGCMYGAFEGILGQLRAVKGAPFDAFPAAMMKYGKAGVSGWGTLCGALNGAAAAIYLVSEPQKADGLIDELFAWYGAEGLPDYKPRTPKFEIKASVAKSPLCHISVTTWCETTGFKALSPERAERCAWLTASVVKHTAEALNAWSDGKAVAMPPLSAEVSGCLSCHGKGGLKENVHASKASTCTTCHDDLGDKHPAKK